MHRGLILQCLVAGYTHKQCSEALDHFFPGRTDGNPRRIEFPLQSLLNLKDAAGKWTEDSFDTWVRSEIVEDVEVEEINRMMARWKTLQTHKGVLLRLLLDGYNREGCARLLEFLLPNRDEILTTTTPPTTSLEDRINEACSLFAQYEPSLRVDGSWEQSRIETWIKAWKTNDEVAEIMSGLDLTDNEMAGELPSTDNPAD